MKILILIPIIGLTFAILAHIFDLVRPQTQPSINQPLSELIPAHVEGWSMADLPLAETEEMQLRIGEILDFDDYISRVYSRGNTQLILYVAYWKPGTTPIKQAQEHTPDICWVANGWQAIKRKHQIDLGNAFLKNIHPAEYRVFEKQGQEQSVVFWHLVGDQVYFNKNTKTDAMSGNFLKTLAQFGIDQKKEQFFIRLSSNKEMTAVLADSRMKGLLEAIKQLVALPIVQRS